MYQNTLAKFYNHKIWLKYTRWGSKKRFECVREFYSLQRKTLKYKTQTFKKNSELRKVNHHLIVIFCC